VTIALETDMRDGEIMDMEWERVDLSRGVIRLERTKSRRRREVPMRQAVYDALAGQPEPREGRVWPDQSSTRTWRPITCAPRSPGPSGPWNQLLEPEAQQTASPRRKW
jgi:integrase